MTNLEKSNKLIAEFMTDEPEVLKRDLNKAGTVDSMHYNDSWDWLTPVIEKIEELGVSTTIRYLSLTSENAFEVRWYKLDYFHRLVENKDSISKISIVHQGVVEFIKWYKENIN